MGYVRGIQALKASTRARVLNGFLSDYQRLPRHASGSTSVANLTVTLGNNWLTTIDSNHNAIRKSGVEHT